MGIYSDKPLVLSVTSENAIDVPTLKANGVACIMARCSDGHQLNEGSGYDIATFTDTQFSSTVDACYKNSIPLGAVHVFRPDVIQSPNKEDDLQFRALSYALKNKKAGVSYHFIVLDVTAGGDTDSNIRTKVEKFSGWINDTYPGIPLVIYSTDNYLTAVSPSLVTLIARQNASWPMFMAQWQANAKFITTTWEDLKGLVPSDSIKVITPGFASWMFWQWALVRDIEGTTGLTGVSFFNGTVDRLREIAGLGETTEPAESVDTPTEPEGPEETPAETETEDTAGTVVVAPGSLIELTEAIEALTETLKAVFRI